MREIQPRLSIFAQPERAYHLSELRRLTGLGSASLQREINKLVSAQLVLSEMVGNQRQISANKQSNLAKISKIKVESMNRAEIDRMFGMSRRRLQDANYSAISQEGRFTRAKSASSK